MDNFETLLQKGDYQTVIDFLDKSSDPQEILYCITAYLGLHKSNIALKKIKDNQEMLFKAFPKYTLTIHFELLMLEHRFSEAIRELEIYKEYPYVSQEVEEFIHDVPKMIEEAEKEERRRLENLDKDFDNIILTSNNDIEIMNALSNIRKNGIDESKDAVAKLIKRNEINPTVRTFALLMLVAIKYDKEISFTKFGNTYNVVPKNLKEPFIGDEFEKTKNFITDTCKDLSVSKVAIDLLNQYWMIIYPDTVDFANKYVAYNFIFFAMQYMGQNPDINEFTQKYNLDLNKLDEQVNKMSELFANDKPLGETN